MTSFKKDYDFWIESENKILAHLNKAGYKIEPHKEEMSVLDFIMTADDKKVNIELKTRRCTKDAYVSTLIWANKLSEAWNKFYKHWEETLFLFSYMDWLYYINPFDFIPKRDFRLQRWDRGINSAKWWLYYDTKNLKEIFKI